MAKRRSRKPAVAQNEVLARTLASQSKSQIAREMGIDRQTVTRIQECHNLPQLLSDSRQYVAERVVPDAIQSAHAQILDRDAPGDGNLAVRVLEGAGVLGKDAGPQTVVYDERTQWAISFLAPPRAAAQPRPALGDSGSVPASGEASNCAGNATQAPAQAEPTPEPAQPTVHPPRCECKDCICPKSGKQREPRDPARGTLLSNRCLCVPHSENCACAGCTIAQAIAKASAASANGEVDEGDASAQEARGGGEWW